MEAALGELPQVVGDGAGVDHVEAVAMRTMVRIKRLALLDHFGFGLLGRGHASGVFGET